MALYQSSISAHNDIPKPKETKPGESDPQVWTTANIDNSMGNLGELWFSARKFSKYTEFKSSNH